MASAQVDGFRLAFAVGAGLALVGAVRALAPLRLRREDAIAAAGQLGVSGDPVSPEGNAVALDVDGLARDIEVHLREQGLPERAVGEKAYLRSDLEFYGATVPKIRRTVKAFWARHPDIGHDDLVSLVQALWDRPVHECRSAAIALLELYRGRLEADDSVMIERMLRQAGTWALVDDLSASVMGPQAPLPSRRLAATTRPARERSDSS